MKLVWIALSVMYLVGLPGCGVDGPPMPPKTEDLK